VSAGAAGLESALASLAAEVVGLALAHDVATGAVDAAAQWTRS